MVARVFVEKKPGFDIEAQQLARELREFAGITNLKSLRLLNRYDVEGISETLFNECVTTVFSEPQTDLATPTLSASEDETMFAVEALPGQFDQRAASAAECIQLISQQERPRVRSGRVYVLRGETGVLAPSDIATIKHYVINPVESREATLELLDTLADNFPTPAPVEVINGFTTMDECTLSNFLVERGLAMDLADILFCQRYFRDKEQRDPTITEIKVIDTYWSDHCRHTTFNTELTHIDIEDANVKEAFERYLRVREELGRANKPISLMDIGTIAARYFKHTGQLSALDESEEINACTVRVKVDVDGEEQDWLYLFKNETHNHPTEIEPFGGAATCIGGAIRDPLSGRAYVYQAMRLTGAADPTVPASDTLAGKLPQRKLVTTAAQGYSSYGNQIGLATGQVHELYHPGYAAKHMEIGAVVGAVPAANVRREAPVAGDIIVLLGGRTGRDGIGGATGSSKAHSTHSLESCGAEVQKGNAPMERKIQRLFRNAQACRMIKRCNDFGAGGVSVAIGELADGLEINLDAIPKKYEGLDGTELALSESQERMAVALAHEDVAQFLELARQENLEATPVATVSAEARVRMSWHGDTIVNISRSFLASNGAPKQASACVVTRLDGITHAKDACERAFEACASFFKTPEDLLGGHVTLQEALCVLMHDINHASNKGLAERFDSTIGAGCVLMPFGGARQLTPSHAMVSKLPVPGGKTTTVSGMSWGFNPHLSEYDPFAGGYMAVTESLAKLIATGFKRRDIYLSFQEYFEKLRNDPERWGKPLAALLGACMAQLDFDVAAIGGKDSMSGSFEQLDVPPTLVSFATAVGSVGTIVSPELKAADHKLVHLSYAKPTPHMIASLLDVVEHIIENNWAAACSVVGTSGTLETLFKMCVGNQLGAVLNPFAATELFEQAPATFVLELTDGLSCATLDKLICELGHFEDVKARPLGRVSADYFIVTHDERIDLSVVQEAWESGIEDVYPYRKVESAHDAHKNDLSTTSAAYIPSLSYTGGTPAHYHGAPSPRPRVVIPVFPGTNCEYDTAAAFEAAGAKANTLIINNLTPQAIAESIAELTCRIKTAQIVMIPGGFSGGDEPDGAAKFITACFRAPEVTEAVRDLLQQRDGLMLGICNGFQALVKLGLVPYGDIRPMDESCPTLTFNTIGRHQSMMVHTRVASNLSPWLAECEVGNIHTVAISHGEGRFVAPDAALAALVEHGQVATQYVNENGAPSMDLNVNPNGSLLAIEGITSPDGRILGKMGHSERSGEGLYKNIPDLHNQPLFTGGVKYFQ